MAPRVPPRAAGRFPESSPRGASSRLRRLALFPRKWVIDRGSLWSKSTNKPKMNQPPGGTNQKCIKKHKPKMHQPLHGFLTDQHNKLLRAPSILHANPATVKLGRATGRILPRGELLDDLHRDPHASLCPREIQVAVTSSASQSVWLGGSELEPSFPFTLGKKASGDCPKPIQST